MAVQSRYLQSSKKQQLNWLKTTQGEKTKLIQTKLYQKIIHFFVTFLYVSNEATRLYRIGCKHPNGCFAFLKFVLIALCTLKKKR